MGSRTPGEQALFRKVVVKTKTFPAVCVTPSAEMDTHPSGQCAGKSAAVLVVTMGRFAPNPSLTDAEEEEASTVAGGAADDRAPAQKINGDSDVIPSVVKGT